MATCSAWNRYTSASWRHSCSLSEYSCWLLCPVRNATTVLHSYRWAGWLWWSCSRAVCACATDECTNSGWPWLKPPTLLEQSSSRPEWHHLAARQQLLHHLHTLREQVPFSYPTRHRSTSIRTASTPLLHRSINPMSIPWRMRNLLRLPTNRCFLLRLHSQLPGTNLEVMKEASLQNVDIRFYIFSFVFSHYVAQPPTCMKRIRSYIERRKKNVQTM